MAGGSFLQQAYKRIKTAEGWAPAGSRLAGAAGALYDMTRAYNRKQPKKKKVAARKGGKRRTRTRTKTRRKQGSMTKTTESPAIAGFLTVHRVTYKKPKLPKYLDWAKNPIIYENNVTWSCASGSNTNTQGKQVVSNINGTDALSIGSKTIINSMFTQHALIRNTIGPAWINSDPNNATGSAHQHLYLKGIKLHFSWTNMAPTTVEGHIYICTRKVSSDKAWANDEPLDDWTLGYTKTAGQTGTRSKEDLGAKPYDAKWFNQNWSILNKVHFVNDAGQESRHIETIGINRLLDMAHVNDMTSGIKGINVRCFVVAQGPTVDSTTDFTVGNITTAKVKIAGILKVEYLAYAVLQFPRIMYRTSNITTSNATAYAIADAAGTVINTETGTNYA